MKTAKPRVLFTVSAALASSATFAVVTVAMIGMAGCGGGSGGGRPGSGGSGVGGTGGSPGTNGTGGGGVAPGTGGAAVGGTGGATGAGGATACSIPIVEHGPLVCSPGISPAVPLITDFTPATWNNTMGKWGCGLTGGLYQYNNPMTALASASTIMAAVDFTAHHMLLSGNVASGGYAGGGLAFSQCVNTTVYTGVRFTVGGTAAGCDLYFQVQTYAAQGVANGGGCSGTACYAFPQKMVPTTAGSVTVHFADLAGGMPVGAAAIASQIVGLQWQLQSPPPPASGLQVSCGNVGLTITDVSFVTQ